jgi:hypothetical protein
MAQPDAPDVGAFFKISPLTAGAVFRFELKAQRPRIMIGDKLERARLVEVLEELEDHRVADARVDFAYVDHTLAGGRARFIHRALPLVGRVEETACPICLQAFAEAGDVGKQAVGNRLRQSSGKQLVQIRLENPPGDAALGPHQFDDVSSERRKIVPQSGRTEDRPKGLLDPRPIRAADMGHYVADMRMPAESRNQTARKVVQVDIERIVRTRR